MRDILKLTEQLSKIEEFIQQNKNLDKVARRKAVGQFTFKQREAVDKNFVYFAVASCGEAAGEQLMAQPTVKQKEWKVLLEDGDDYVSAGCYIDFLADKTNLRISVRDAVTFKRKDLYVKEILC